MRLHSLTPNLMVEDVAATVEWYQSALDADVLGVMPTAALDDGSNDEKTAVEGSAAGDTAAVEAIDDDAARITDDAFWAQVAVDDVEIMFQRRDSLEEELPVIEGTPIGGSFTMYVDVDDVEALSEQLADEPRPLAMRTTDYGRQEFAIEDPNGYVLWFGAKTEG